MKAHELAKRLLELPDVEVVVPYESHNLEIVQEIKYDKVDESLRLEDESGEFIFIFGEKSAEYLQSVIS